MSDAPLAALLFDLDSLRLSVEVLKNSTVTKASLSALQAQIIQVANSIAAGDKCPACGRYLTRVLESRGQRRRRACECGHRFTTSEITRL